MLQHEKRLTARRQEITAKKKWQYAEIGDSDGKWLEAIAKELFDIEQKLFEVRKLYHAHLINMRRLLQSTKKGDAFYRGLILECKCQYSIIPGRNRPHFWLKAKSDCAQSGGCCDRECRCCDKPLSVYVTDSVCHGRRKLECMVIALLTVGVVSGITVVTRRIPLEIRKRRRKLLERLIMSQNEIESIVERKKVPSWSSAELVEVPRPDSELGLAYIDIV